VHACLLLAKTEPSQFFDAVYVVGGDKANPTNVYIYDAAKKSWTTQATTGGHDTTSFEAILDHDTNFFYAASKGELWALNMSTEAAASSSPIAWSDQGTVEVDVTDGPTFAVAQNHIFFFGVPNAAAGSTPVFVIHFAFWQPGAQAMGGSFPSSHGQATSIFLDTGVQQQIAFIPDDGSQTYIIDVETNTTSTMPGPSTKDPKSLYFASTTSIVQLASNGAVSWIPFNPTDTSANSNAKWSSVANLAAVAPPSGSSTSTNSSSSKTTGGGGAAGTGTGTSTASKTTGTSAGMRNVAWGAGSVLGLLGAAFSLL